MGALSTRLLRDKPDRRPARMSADDMTCLVGWGLSVAWEVVTAAGGNSDRELARDNFRLLPWTSAADRVRICECRQDAGSS